MTQIPFIPESAPFSSAERQWLNGWLAGALVRTPESEPTPDSAKRTPLLILFGSQTGTAEGLAKQTARLAEASGYAVKTLGMDQFENLDWADLSNLLVVTSTYGDGEPPDNAIEFWRFLNGESAPTLSHVRFSVLALGDTNYPQFCEFGKKCDARLEALGAQQVHARVDCDVDYESPAEEWMKAVLHAIRPAALAAPLSFVGSDHAERLSSEKIGRSRKHPLETRLISIRKLTRDGSQKDVRHLEISLADVSYEVGDALGVYPTNCPELVENLLAVMGCSAEEPVKVSSGEELPLGLALLNHCEIGKLTPDLLNVIAEIYPESDVRALMKPEHSEELRQWLTGRDLLDVLSTVPNALPADVLVPLLKRLQPRLYSISSSPKAHPGEVHLTIGVVRYETHGRKRKGVCSTFLAERCRDSTPVPVWVQTSTGFRLPTDPGTDIIMVGPGTGIAPFRAFLEERQAVGASGRNWLFFGDQHRACDYLYEESLEAWRKDGHLSRLDLAFSRDQTEKLYVQHRLLETADELWRWLDGGAHFYVCGDASRMAKDVDAALRQVIERSGGFDADGAIDYVEQLKREKRYQRDVY